MSYPTSTQEWLGKLISFDTTSVKSNLESVEYIKAYLASVGVQSVLVYNEEKTHANLFATLPGEGGATQGGLLLAGHIDVVPVAGQKWDTDPFQMVEKDGKLYGRGTSDMKGFLAICLGLTPTFLSMKRGKPIHFGFTFNEELGCTGAPYLVTYLKSKNFKADGCIVGEPTGMVVYTGNKGMTEWKTVVQGKAIHSSMALMNTSCNAIEYAAMIVTKVREIAMDLKANGPKCPGYDCPFACMNTGIITGGNAVNTVPAECEFVFNIRVTEDELPVEVEKRVQEYVQKEILPAMKAEYKDASVSITRNFSYPGFAAEEDHPFIKAVRHMCNDTGIHRAGGGTEAGYYMDGLGIPTVIVGPGTGLQAHVANEYVEVALMKRCEAFTLDMVKLYSQKGNL